MSTTVIIDKTYGLKVSGSNTGIRSLYRLLEGSTPLETTDTLHKYCAKFQLYYEWSIFDCFANYGTSYQNYVMFGVNKINVSLYGYLMNLYSDSNPPSNVCLYVDGSNNQYEISKDCSTTADYGTTKTKKQISTNSLSENTPTDPTYNITPGAGSLTISNLSSTLTGGSIFAYRVDIFSNSDIGVYGFIDAVSSFTVSNLVEEQYTITITAIGNNCRYVSDTVIKYATPLPPPEPPEPPSPPTGVCKSSIVSVTHKLEEPDLKLPGNDWEIKIYTKIKNNDDISHYYAVYVYNDKDEYQAREVSNILDYVDPGEDVTIYIYSGLYPDWSAKTLGDFYKVKVYCDCGVIYCEDNEFVQEQTVTFTEDEKKKTQTSYSLCDMVGLNETQCKYATWGAIGIGALLLFSVVKKFLK